MIEQGRWERFWSKVLRAGPNECWVWAGARHNEGYGLFMMHSADLRYAHRAMWVLTHGPIPKGLCVLHHCDNPPCVNPSHLYIGTMGDNIRDRDLRGRTSRGDQHGIYTRIGMIRAGVLSA